MPLTWLTLAALSCGCASDISTYTQPADFTPVPSPIIVALTADVEFAAPTGNWITLSQGSQWQSVGIVRLGSVYRPVNEVVMLTARHNHESWLVLDGMSLVGFYLPVEGSVLQAEERIDIPFAPLE